MGWGRDESLCSLAGRCWRHPRTPFFSLEASFVCPFLLRAPKTGHLIGGSSSVPASLYFTHYHFGCIDRGGCFAALSLMFAFGGSLARTNALPLCNVWWMLCHWCLLRAWQTLCHRSSTLVDALPSWSCYSVDASPPFCSSCLLTLSIFGNSISSLCKFTSSGGLCLSG